MHASHCNNYCYMILNTRTDIAECDLNLCEQNCTEKQGTYDCFCIDGYTLGNDSHSCLGMCILTLIIIII